MNSSGLNYIVFLNFFKADISAGVRKIFGKNIRDKATIDKCKFFYFFLILKLAPHLDLQNFTLCKFLIVKLVSIFETRDALFLIYDLKF